MLKLAAGQFITGHTDLANVVAFTAFGQMTNNTGSFTDGILAQALDPTTVSLHYAVAPSLGASNGPTTILSYSGASTPGVGIIARLSTGVYEAWLDTTSQDGIWTYEWVSTGIGQTVKSGQFLVVPRTI